MPNPMAATGDLAPEKIYCEIIQNKLQVVEFQGQFSCWIRVKVHVRKRDRRVDHSEAWIWVPTRIWTR
jgi:hypothetical protein